MKPAKLLASMALVLVAAAIGSLFTAPSIPTWYASLAKPWFSPPNWLFAPAWTVLYILMGLSLYLVWSARPSRERSLAIAAFAVQLALNVLWSVLFFGLQSPALAFAGIIALWASIAATIALFRRASARAAWLLVPYIIWVSFAAALNLSVWLLNA